MCSTNNYTLQIYRSTFVIKKNMKGFSNNALIIAACCCYVTFNLISLFLNGKLLLPTFKIVFLSIFRIKDSIRGIRN